MSTIGGRDLLNTALRREVRRATNRDPRMFPHFTEDGRWRLLAADQTSAWRGDTYDHGNWTFGFWFGVMWLASQLAGSDAAAGLARERMAALRPRARDKTTHDLGFIFWPSIVLGEKMGLLPTETTSPAVTAAHTLADRFNPHGGYLQAFGARGDQRGAGTSTIDTMMNLPLLWWAGTVSGERRLFDVARQHAVTSAETFIRADGATYHLNHFDPETGVLRRQGTFQGAGPDSCWSRGQAWAAAGFAIAYAATADLRMLAAAERTADYFWAHLPPSRIPPWDFADTAADAPSDASAAAIACIGALVLADKHPTPERRELHRRRARDVVAHLVQYVDAADDVDGVLPRSSYSVPHRLGLDGATAWGDFYFLLSYALLADRLPLDVILDGTPSNRVAA